MRNRLFAALVIALLSLSLLTGCLAGYTKVPGLPVLQTAAPNTTALLTESQVRSIVAKHAQIEEGAIPWLRTELDLDFGIPKYDVEFISGGWEYDYEIHAQTGVVLSWDKDWND